MFIFYETSDIPRQRHLFENEFGLPVIEHQFHPPHHRHGLVKYDAGSLILALNQASTSAGSSPRSDAFGLHLALPAQLSLADQLVTTPDGHHFYISRHTAYTLPTVTELALDVTDLSQELYFYRTVLGLSLEETSDDTIVVSATSGRLRLRCADITADGLPPQHDTYLLVFYAHPIEEAFDALTARGVIFSSQRVTHSQIGGTARFRDPAGHTFCLYDPSLESLKWGSGQKVIELSMRQ